MKFKNLMIIAFVALALTSCKTTTENTLSYFRNLGDSPSGVMPQGAGYEILRQYPRPQPCLISLKPTMLLEEILTLKLHLACKPISSTRMVTS